MGINREELENWSVRVAKLLQEVCDDAQAAAGELDGEGECLDVRILLQEHSNIMLGRPLWQMTVNDSGDEPMGTLNI